MWRYADDGLDPREAYRLLMQAGRMRLGNMFDPKYSLVAKIEKRSLPG